MKHHLPILCLFAVAACGGKNLSLGGEDPGSKDPAGGAQNPNPGAADETAPACVTVAANPTSLAELPGQLPAAMAVFGSTLYLGVRLDLPLSQLQRGNVLELAISPTGASVPTIAAPDDYVSGNIFADAKRLIFPKGVAISTGPNGWAFDYPNLLVKNRASGQIRTLANPSGDLVMAGETVVTKNGDLYWIARAESGGSFILHWDGTAAEPTIVVEGDNLQNLRTDGSGVFYRSITRGEVTYFTTRLGAAPTPLWSSIDWEFPIVAAVDEDRVYLTKRDGTSATLSAMPKTGGTPTPIATDATINIASRLTIDGPNIYWASGSKVLRMPKAGGPIETISDEANRWVEAVTVDACNVYWTVVNPPEVFARPK